MPLGFWRGIYGFMCKTVWNLALAHGLNPDNSSSTKQNQGLWAQPAQRQSKGLLKHIWTWTKFHFKKSGPYCPIITLSLTWEKSIPHGCCEDKFSNVYGIQIRMVAMVVLGRELRTSDISEGGWWPADTNVLIVSVWIGEVPLSSYLLKSQGKPVIRAVWQGKWVTVKSGTHLHHQASSEPVQTASSGSYWRPRLPFAYWAFSGVWKLKSGNLAEGLKIYLPPGL